MAFIATLTYELGPETAPDARKLLRAELVGRRWFDLFEGKRMPEGTLWARKTAEPGETVDTLRAASARELRAAVAPGAGELVARRRVRLRRSFDQKSICTSELDGDARRSSGGAASSV